MATISARSCAVMAVRSSGLFPGFVVALDPFDRPEFLFPLGFEGTSDQSIGRFDFIILPVRTVRLIPDPLQSELPLLLKGCGLPFELRKRRQRQRNTLRGKRLQDEPLDRGIEVQPPDLLAVSPPIFPGLHGAAIGRILATSPGIAHRHLTTTTSTMDNTLEQRLALARYSGTVRPSRRPVGP